MQVFTDDSAAVLFSPSRVFSWMGEALDLHEDGRLDSPARSHVRLRLGNLVFTVGASPDAYGFRMYDSFEAVHGDQLTVAFDTSSRTIRGLYVGSLLGEYRTGGLVANAVHRLAGRPESLGTVGVIGTGRQAWAAIWALSGGVRVSDVRVFSRNHDRRDAFAARVEATLGVPARAVTSAAEAAFEAAAVLVATSSRSPVLRVDDCSPSAVVASIGPKACDAAELHPDFYGRAVIVTDSAAQLRSYSPPAAVLSTIPPISVLTVSQAAKLGPTNDRVSLYLSTGLSGTEVLMLERLISSDC